MKAMLAFLLAIISPIGLWTACMVHSRLSFMSSGDAEVEGPSLPGETANVHWVSGIVRFINPGTGTVLLQTEKGPLQLFAPPSVLLNLKEGKVVHAYIAADELATTVAI